MIQTEVLTAKDLKGEVERLKDLGKKQRLDLEIKENQVRSLKSRVESHQESIHNMSQAKDDWHTHESQIEGQLKTQKQKTKRYENNLKKSVNALKRIGLELAAMQQQAVYARSDNKSQMTPQQQIKVYQSGEDDEPMGLNDLDKDAAYYKESVQILGLSQHELADFINPTSGQKQAANQPGLGYGKSPQSMVSSTGVKFTRDQSNTDLLDRLENIEEIPETLNRDIDDIGDYCIKLITDLTY